MSTSFIRNRARALTLIEVLVAAGVFVSVGVVLVLALSFSSRSMMKVNNHTDTYRMAMTVLHRIRGELSPCRLITVVPTYVEYKLPARQPDGTLMLSTYNGLPIWLPPGTLDHYIMKEPSGKVVAYHEGGASRALLGNLGLQGTISFALPIPELLEIRVHAEAPDPGLRGRASIYEAVLRLNPAGKT